MNIQLHGTVTEGYEPVRDAFRNNFEKLGDLGAAVTVYRDGRKVLDLWGGVADAQLGLPWTEGTAVILRSVTKGLSAAVLHLLHQRGQLDLDAPVHTYWPDFKRQGKDQLLVRHLLSHRAGLPVLDKPLTPAQAVDGVSGPAALVEQEPEWEPGTAHGYHAQTYNWLFAELVLRATGRTIGNWFAEEIAWPLGLDAWIGLPEAMAHRAARVEEIEVTSSGPKVKLKESVAAAYRDEKSLTWRTFRTIVPAPDENSPEFRAGELPGSAGIATARAVARFYAALMGKLEEPGVQGRRLFTPATLAQARSQESVGQDRVLLVNANYGLGYTLHSQSTPMFSPTSFGNPGRGGSFGFADPESGIAFGYVTNGLQKSVTSDPRSQALVRALKECVTKQG